MATDCIQKRDEYIIQENKDGTKTTVRELQLEILEIMDEIHRVCVKNKIHYALIAGSALGCVNYKGFIPWDDDMDICVLRKDWPRFIEALKKDLSDKFYFQCLETDKKFNVVNGPQMKIRKRGTYIEEVNWLLKNRCTSGNGIFIDVVTYDYMSEKKWKDEVARTVLKVAMPFLVILDHLRIPHTPFKKWYMGFAERYSKKNENSSLMSQSISFLWVKFLKEPVFFKKDVLPFRLYEFEGRKFYSFNHIEPIVKKWYHPNCLKKWDGKEWVETLPVEKRNPKHTAHLNLKGETKKN